MVVAHCRMTRPSSLLPFLQVLWELVLDAADVSTNASVVLPLTITNDGILEMPDETFMFWLYSPGVQPTFGGNLWSTMTILDDGDGASMLHGLRESKGCSSNVCMDVRFGRWHWSAKLFRKVGER